MTTPDVINRYIAAAAAQQLDEIAACFTEDATVLDEGKTYRGRAEIRTWREELVSKYVYTVKVLGSEPDGADKYIVSTLVEGNFPGGRVELKYRFALRGDEIQSLEIA
jgi:ketosteroid isomerase-like protein